MNITNRFRLVCLLALLGFVTLVVTGWLRLPTPSSAQSSGERQLENKVPKEVPLKIALKKEKEALVKALDNENWVCDVQLEITNTSNKPIYYFDLAIVLPEVLSESGYQVGFPIRYGRPEFVDWNMRPTSEDQPFKPGETRTFEISDKFARGWMDRRAAGKLALPRRIEVILGHLSFGDGTGFSGTHGKPYPFTDAKSNCREGPEVKTKSTYSRTLIPAAFLPVNFFIPTSFLGATSTPTTPDLCCPGTPFSKKKPTFYSCACNSNAPSVQSAFCSDPQGQCSIDGGLAGKAESQTFAV
jgi:hypothetical protein